MEPKLLDPALFPTLGHHELRIICAFAIVTGVIVGVGALLALHLLPTGMSVTQSPILLYGYSTFPWVHRIYATGFGLAGIAASVATHLGSHINLSPWGWFAGFAAAEFLDGWLPRDKPDIPAVYSNRVRVILFPIAIYYLIFCFFDTNRIAKTSGSTTVVNFAHDVTALLILSLVFLTGAGLRDVLTKYEGVNWYCIFERFILFVSMPSILLITAFTISR